MDNNVFTRFLGMVNTEVTFFLAVKNNDFKSIKEMVKKKPEFVNAKDKQGKTPLHHAAAGGRLEIARFLLSLKAGVNAKDIDGFTPLYFAVFNGHKDVADAIRKYGGVALGGIHGAVKDGNVDRVRELLQKFPEMTGEKEDRLQGTPLHYAAMEGNEEIARMLIRAGANVNAQGAFDYTPLHYAAKGGHGGMAKLLLEGGADGEARDSYGNTVSMVARREGHGEIAGMIEAGQSSPAPVPEPAEEPQAAASLPPVEPPAAAPSPPATAAPPQEGPKGWTGEPARPEPAAKAIATPPAEPAKVEAVARPEAARPSMETRVFLSMDTPPVKDISPREIIDAAKDGDLEKVQAIIRAHPRAVMEKDIDFDATPLHYAVFKGHTEISAFLLQSGADISWKNSSGKAPLHYAVENGKLELVRMLVQHGADVNSATSQLLTPLHYAAQHGLMDVCRILISAGANLRVASNTGQTPLHYAAYYKNLPLVSYFVEMGADVNAGDREGVTPLHFACRYGQMEIVTVLAGKGASLEAGNKDGSTPLHFAAENGQEAALEFLVKAGADLDRKNLNGWTPLHYAAHEGRTEAAKMLLLSGADPEVRDGEGHSPLYHALLKFHTDTAEVLSMMSLGDIMMEVSPLHFAAMLGKTEVIRQLLESGYDPNSTTGSGKTPLHYEAFDGRTEPFALLSGAGANVNALDSRGLTPLHVAARGGFMGMAALLLNAGAQVNARDENLMTPLHHAAVKGQAAMIEALLAAGADPCLKDESGQAPVHAALESGIREGVDALMQDERCRAMMSSPQQRQVAVPAPVPAAPQAVSAPVEPPLPAPLPEAYPHPVEPPGPPPQEREEAPAHSHMHVKVVIKHHKPVEETYRQAPPPAAGEPPRDVAGGAGEASLPEDAPSAALPPAAGQEDAVRKLPPMPRGGPPAPVDLPADLEGTLAKIRQYSKFAGTVDVDQRLKWSAFSYLNKFAGNVKGFFPESPAFAVKASRYKLTQLEDFEREWRESGSLNRDFLDVFQGIYNLGTIDTFNVFRSSQPSLEDIAWFVNDLGLKVVVNLCGAEEIWDGFTLKDEEMLCLEHQIDYYHFPLEMWDPTPIDFETINGILDRIDYHAKPILVHSHNGSDRVSVIGAAFRMRQLGWSLKDALAEADHFGFSSEDSPNQVEVLRRFERS